MRQERQLSDDGFDERTRQAIREVQAVIAARYPATIFELARAADDPRGIHLLAITDVDDPDEVGDLVIDRIVALQVDEGIPLHVIPLRMPERVQAALVADRRRVAPRSARLVRLLGDLV
ncbi:MAG: hypothetical protein H0V00_19835 [Chloroflexia bacterium]|nr:hypothetical protein [Chloroflexia bacterium]